MRTAATVNASAPNPTYVSSSGGNGGGPDPFVDIGKLETHVGWLTKGLIGLAVVSAGILGWLIVNLYTPMHDIATNVAVLSSTTGDLKTDVGEIKKQVEDVVVSSRLKAGSSTSLPNQAPRTDR
jgi:hypothetical protein